MKKLIKKKDISPGQISYISRKAGKKLLKPISIKDENLEILAFYLEYNYLNYLEKNDFSELWDYVGSNFIEFWSNINNSYRKLVFSLIEYIHFFK